jgi:hypothetical protein
VACSEVKPSRRQRPWPVGLLGMLVLVFVVEVNLPRFDSRLTPLGASNWRQTGAAARTSATHVDVLLFGDSLVKTGLLPTIFEEERGLTSYNLALLGAPPSASYFMLRRALDSGARPRAIVLDAQPSILMECAPSSNPREWAELLSLKEAMQLAKVEHLPDVITHYVMTRYIPSVRYRFDIQKAASDLFRRTTSSSDVSWLALHDRQQDKNRGGYVNPSTPGRFGPDSRPNGKVLQEEVATCYPGAWWGRPPNLAFLEKFLKLAESHEIPVFFLIPPIHPGVQSERERLGLDELYLTLIRKIQRRYRSVIVVDGRHSGFDHGLFWDAFHLGRQGATALSRGLAEVIGTRLAHPSDSDDHWVSLPTFVEPSRWVAIEDTDESIALLRDPGTIRR